MTGGDGHSADGFPGPPEASPIAGDQSRISLFRPSAI